jgi:uncharacterized protein (TIGR00106 family)
MIVADISMIPMGKGTSASHYVQAVHELLRKSGMKYAAGPMSTAIEAQSFDQIFSAVEKANNMLAEMGVQRVITTIRIDYRLDKDISIRSKIERLQ